MCNFLDEREQFEVYFQKNKFKDFEKFIGVSEDAFRDLYEQYKSYVQEYYNNFVPKGSNLYPLVAEICSYAYLDFYTTLHDDHHRVKYPAVSVFEGEYYATQNRVDIQFLSCDEVMRRLMLVYWINQELFDEAKSDEPCEVRVLEGKDVIAELLEFFEKMGVTVIRSDHE